MYLIDEIQLSAITRHSFPISTLIPSLNKMGQKVLQIERENEELTDGQTDRHSNANFLTEGVT